MGTEVVYGGLSRLCFHASTGWKPALSRPSSALCARTQTRAQWLVSSVVCGPHRRLPPMRVAGSVSRKPFHQQTTTGQCRDLAPLFARGRSRCTHHRPAFASPQADRGTPACSCPLEGLATLSDPPPLAQSCTERNGDGDEGHPNGGTNAGNQGAHSHPDT